MKYILYLSGILFFLSGCKGNAFLKQRYTHYNHVSAKKGNQAPVVNTRMEEPFITASAGKAINENIVGSAFQHEKLILAEPSQNTVDEKAEIPQTFSRSLNEPQMLNDKKGFMKYTPQVKNHFQKMSESKRGVIGTLLEIVLSIIVLALIITVVILVILLV